MKRYKSIANSFAFALAAMSFVSVCAQAMAPEEANVNTTIGVLRKLGVNGILTSEKPAKKLQITSMDDFNSGAFQDSEDITLSMYRDKDDWRGFACKMASVPPPMPEDPNYVYMSPGPDSFTVFLKEVE